MAERRLGLARAWRYGSGRREATSTTCSGPSGCRLAPFTGALVTDQPPRGWWRRLDARLVAPGRADAEAGRQRKGAVIDPSTGVVLMAKVGDRVVRGQALATIHAPDESRAEAAERLLLQAYEIGERPVPIQPLIHWRSA